MKFGRSIVFVTAFASSGVHAGFVCDFGGVIDVNERCDDGNQTSDDGCSNCSIDLDFSCAGAPSVCAPVQFAAMALWKGRRAATTPTTSTVTAALRVRSNPASPATTAVRGRLRQRRRRRLPGDDDRRGLLRQRDHALGQTQAELVVDAACTDLPMETAVSGWTFPRCRHCRAATIGTGAGPRRAPRCLRATGPVTSKTPRFIGPSAITARPSPLPSLAAAIRCRRWWSASSMASSTAAFSPAVLLACGAARVVRRCLCRFRASAAASVRRAPLAAPRIRPPISSTTCCRACRIDSGCSRFRSLSDWH